MSHPQHLIQYDRAYRYLTRISKQENYANLSFFEDDVWSFFLHAWHIKYRLKTAPKLKKQYIKPDGLNNYLLHNDYKYIEICHDIATQQKHYKIDKPSPSKASIDKIIAKVTLPMKYCIVGERTKIPVITGKTTLEIIIKDFSEVKYDAVELGQKILNEWQLVFTAVLDSS